ncbi:YheU family protein [Chromatiaceae bacterium AAb-1]|jgi:uncharacterized protein YheU (UPF0270 family)|nr:YheU family protein [Chromatiaceae bacterium AAb-1]
MIIPWQQIPDDTLHNLIEYYVLREGTDYGEQEIPLQQKVEQVKQQLIAGDIVVAYSELHETINLLPANSPQLSGGE